MALDFTSASIARLQARPQVPQPQFFCDEVGRREFICGGGAGVLSVILAALLGASKPVRAESVTGSVPELDRVAVRIVIDSYQFAVAPSRKLPSLDVQHFGWGLSDKSPSRTLVSDHPAAVASAKLPRSEPQSNQAVRHLVPCATPSHESSNASRSQILINCTPMMIAP
jgi:7,8-dihydropterin-6-yl-methyl-4-(beta-D-ribofuranosyl)aminobenzene 5'-phosphate synthase